MVVSRTARTSWLRRVCLTKDRFGPHLCERGPDASVRQPQPLRNRQTPLKSYPKDPFTRSCNDGTGRRLESQLKRVCVDLGDIIEHELEAVDGDVVKLERPIETT